MAGLPLSILMWLSHHQEGNTGHIYYSLMVNSLEVNIALGSLLLLLHVLTWTVAPIASIVDESNMTNMILLKALSSVLFHDITWLLIAWIRYYKAARTSSWHAIDMDLWRVRGACVSWGVFISCIILLIGSRLLVTQHFGSLQFGEWPQGSLLIQVIPATWFLVRFCLWLLTLVPYCLILYTKTQLNVVDVLPSQEVESIFGAQQPALELSAGNLMHLESRSEPIQLNQAVPEQDDLDRVLRTSFRSVLLTSIMGSSRWILPAIMSSAQLEYSSTYDTAKVLGLSDSDFAWTRTTFIAFWMLCESLASLLEVLFASRRAVHNLFAKNAP